MIKPDLSKKHRAITERLQKILKTGKNVMFLTLGDPSFYTTPYHIIDILLQNEYSVEVISGIPSVSASSARLQIPLAMGKESVLITSGDICDFSGTQVILKAGSHFGELCNKVRSFGKTAYMIENCGMENEKVYSDIDSFPSETGYFSILIIK